MDQSSAATLVTADGVQVKVRLTSGPGSLAFVVAHGITGHGEHEHVRSIVDHLSEYGAVITVDLRGHGGSGGQSTVGMWEVLDVDRAVAWARELGFRSVVSVGFSLGAAVCIRQAALALHPELTSEADPGVGSPVDAIVTVSGPAFWYYRGTKVMRVLHWCVETKPGRLLLRAKGTHIRPVEWPQPRPIEPHVAAGMLGSTPLLVVHGTKDRYFPVEHPRAIHRAAVTSGHLDAELWLLDGVGHAEAAVAMDTIDEIAKWSLARCSD